MRQPSDHHKSDWVLVQKCLSGEARILEGFIQRYEPVLRRKLVQRGATPSEAEEIIAVLWADCVPVPEGGARGSLLEKFSGQTSFQSWLLTVATRRLIDLKRSQRLTVSGETPGPEEEAAAYCLLDRAPAEPERGREDSLLALLQQCLRAAWNQTAPEELLILQLIHLHGLTQREIARMWGWTESKVSRSLNLTMRHIQAETFRQLKQSDPWLELTWQDFVDLCETRRIGFF